MGAHASAPPLIFAMLLAAACAAPVAGEELGELPASSFDGGARDGGPSGDGGLGQSGRADSGTDGGPWPKDAGAPPRDGGSAADGGAAADAGSLADAGALPVDAGAACTPTRTQCNTALECGSIPNGCPGGVFECNPCGGGETWCIQFPESRWGNKVYNCVQASRSAHPEWFDGDLVVAAYAEAYVREVAGCADAGSALCIVDLNAPGNEIRCRAEDGAIAENFIVRTYGGGGRYAARYTSSCTPAFF